MFNIVILGRCLLFEKKAFISALNLPVKSVRIINFPMEIT